MYKDCDTAVHMTKYLFDRFEHNYEQRLWISWLYGTTYYLPTTWVIWNEFPDMELVGEERLEFWNNINYKRLRYQTDTKWNKGHLPDQFLSYKKWVGNKTQQEAFSPFLIGSPQENFSALWTEINEKLHKFGRYSTWFYLQTLKHCCDLPLEPKDLVLEDYSGSRSHRNGLLYAVGWDDLVDQKLSKVELDALNKISYDILEEVRSDFPSTDYFEFETCLCSFKKIFRDNETRWIGYYIARQREEISTVENDGWFGIDWKPLWDFRKECLDNRFIDITLTKENKSGSSYLQTGEIKLPWEKRGLEFFT